VIFNSVYGIGPATAKKLFDKGLRSIEELRKMPETYKQERGDNDRIDYGLAFFEDLSHLTLTEAKRIFSILNTVAQTILPGIRVDLTGGFRRGKTEGHDADFLFSHPEDGTEIGFLFKLYKKLVSMGFILHGQIFSEQYFKKLGSKSTMDSFEKCFSIFRCPTNDSAGLQDMASFTTHKTGSFAQLWEESQKTRSWKAARVDLVVCPSSQYAYALVGWTGNKQFNRSLRTYASKELNLKLTSHGLWNPISKELLPSSSEKDVFRNLNLDYLEPCERNA